MVDIQNLCLLSGGYDSAAAWILALAHGHSMGLFFQYKQPYMQQELAGVSALGRVTSSHPHAHGIILADLPLEFDTHGDDPYVPHRNLALMAIAANVAEHRQVPRIVTGSKSLVHRVNDPVSFHDSTAAFYHGVQQLISTSTSDPPAPLVWAPLMGWSKRQVLEFLKYHEVPLRQLWNCYSRASEPCGKCAHCRETQPLLDALDPPTSDPITNTLRVD